MLKAYLEHVAEREAQNIPPLPMDAQQTADLVEYIKHPADLSSEEKDMVMDLFVNRVPPGVDDASYVKAGFLADVAGNKREELLHLHQMCFHRLVFADLGLWRMAPWTKR